MNDRFRDWYGGSECSKCMYYRKSRKYHKMRCDHDTNTRENWLGAVYMKHPDELNWNNRCKNFKRRTPGADK